MHPDKANIHRIPILRERLYIMAPEAHQKVLQEEAVSKS